MTDELANLQATLEDVAKSQPHAVLLALMEQLVDQTCGTNRNLKDFFRLLQAAVLPRRTQDLGQARSIATRSIPHRYLTQRLAIP